MQNTRMPIYKYALYMNADIHARMLDALAALNALQTAGPYNVLRVIACLPVDANLSRVTEGAMEDHIDRCKANDSNADLIARHHQTLSIIKDGHLISSVNVDYLGKLVKNLSPFGWIATYRSRERKLKLISDRRDGDPENVVDLSNSDSEDSEDDESDEYHGPASAGDFLHARRTRSATVAKGPSPATSAAKRRADDSELDGYVLTHRSSSLSHLEIPNTVPIRTASPSVPSASQASKRPKSTARSAPKRMHKPLAGGKISKGDSSPSLS